MSECSPQVPAVSPMRFMLCFALAFGVLYAMYLALPDELLRRSVYPLALAQPAAHAINALAPSEQVRVSGNALIAARTSLSIVRGCDGAGFLSLLIAAIAAYPAPWRRKLVGVLGASAFVYLLNEARIVVLYFVSAHLDAHLTTVHVYLLPTLLVAAAGAFFLLWAPPAARLGAT